jgi:hypothetical protein
MTTRRAGEHAGVALLALLAGALLALLGGAGPARAAQADALPTVPILSPYWPADIQRRAGTIAALAEANGFHPDFVAAVIAQEAQMGPQAIGRLGAVGLLGIPSGGTEWRPSAQALLSSSADMRWGLAVLSHVVRQAGGDLHTALAAYYAGWQQVDARQPREYAERVLDSYGRALLVRAGLAPEAAERWTVAVAIRAGNVPDEPLLVLGHRPITGLRTFVPHTLYAFADETGRVTYVSGYVVPVGLSESVVADSGRGEPDTLEAPLRARLGEKNAGASGNPRVLLACLAGLERLRGRVTTRWYGPSGCPAYER